MHGRHKVFVLSDPRPCEVSLVAGYVELAVIQREIRKLEIVIVPEFVRRLQHCVVAKLYRKLAEIDIARFLKSRPEIHMAVLRGAGDLLAFDDRLARAVGLKVRDPVFKRRSSREYFHRRARRI